MLEQCASRDTREEIASELAYDFQMRCVLGFDGGATKTECVLMDAEGSVMAVGRSGASNPVRVGFERAIAEVKQAAESALLEARVERNTIRALCAGIAGTGRAEMTERMRAPMAAMFPGIVMKICTDLEIALAAAEEGPAIVLIAGTGSAAMGRGVGGETRRAGGFGAENGDEGSARDIGKKAAMAAKLHREQSGEESALGKQLLRQLGFEKWRELGGADPNMFPRLFPVVSNAADAGDETARELLREAANHLAALVKELVEDLSFREVPFRLLKMGGMIGRCAFFDDQLDLHLREAAPSATMEVPLISPAHAAALLALQLTSGREDSNG